MLVVGSSDPLYYARLGGRTHLFRKFLGVVIEKQVVAVMAGVQFVVGYLESDIETMMIYDAIRDVDNILLAGALLGPSIDRKKSHRHRSGPITRKFHDPLGISVPTSIDDGCNWDAIFPNVLPQKAVECIFLPTGIKLFLPQWIKNRRMNSASTHEQCMQVTFQLL